MISLPGSYVVDHGSVFHISCSLIMLPSVWLPVHLLLISKRHGNGKQGRITGRAATQCILWPEILHVIYCYKAWWVGFVWSEKAWHLLELDYTAEQAAMGTVLCVCVGVCWGGGGWGLQRENSIIGNSLRTRPGLQLKKKQGPPPLWQTSAFALRPVEISNLCLTCRKGQVHPWLPSGVEPDHFFSAPLDTRKSTVPTSTVQIVSKWHTRHILFFFKSQLPNFKGF